MLKGIAASSGIAIGKVYKLVEPKIELLRGPVKPAKNSKSSRRL